MIFADPSSSLIFLSRPWLRYDGSPCFSSSGWSLFDKVKVVRSFYSLTSFALSFIKKMPVPDFSKEYYLKSLTWVVGMLHQFLVPSLGYSDPLLFGIIVTDLEALRLCIRDDVFHILFFESAQNTEEKLSFWKLIWKLLLGWKVFAQHRVSHRVIIEILHRYFLVGGNLKSNHLILFEM